MRYSNESYGSKEGPLGKALQMILDHPNTYAFPFLKLYTVGLINLHFADQNGDHDFIIGKEPYYSAHTYFFMKKATLYQSDFNMHLLKLCQNGLMSHFIEKTRDQNKKNGRKLAKMQNRPFRLKHNEILTNENLFGTYILTGGMIGVSFLCLILENFFKPENKRK